MNNNQLELDQLICILNRLPNKKMEGNTVKI